MNTFENIEYQARLNAKNVGPKREEDINKDIPYFKIYKTSNDRLDIEGYNHHKHDNAPRMDLFNMYMKYSVLPHLQDANICGYYNIELHDSYTYLKNDKSYKDVLTFSKFKNDVDPVLIPDPYMIVNWGNHKIEDNTPWENKTDKACFFGTTTGDRDPLTNRRIKMCIWSLENQDLFNFKITKVAQMNENDIIKAYGIVTWNKIYVPQHISYEQQMQYKFHFLPDGNTCKFDIWYFKTNTLCFKDESKDMMWYYPMLRNKEHYIEATQDTLVPYHAYYINNPKETNRIIENAKNFAKDVFRPNTHIFYMKTLFEAMGDNAP